MKNNIRWLFVVLLIGMFAGCIYEDSFYSGEYDYITLYDKQAIALDTGWSSEQMATFKIPVWNELTMDGRDQVGTIEAGVNARILRKSKYGYQIITPDEGIIGWVNKIYVKSEFSTDVAPVYIVSSDLPSSTSTPSSEYDSSKVAFVERRHEQDAIRPVPVNQ